MLHVWGMAMGLKREIGLFGATMMGLGSIIGTGVFVSLSIAAEAAGPAVLLAIGLASIVAACNGLSSAQLAAAHPVSGGTYEYGYRWLTPSLGFIAGWMFLCAKSASAATAALGLAGYTLNLWGVSHPSMKILCALSAIVLLTVVVLSGIRRSSNSNVAVVSFTIGTLSLLVVVGCLQLPNRPFALTPFFAPLRTDQSAFSGLLQATALMFVAFTGYGRIATMAEEVREPHRTIPLAVVVTLGVSAVLYIAVAFVSISAVGIKSFAEAGTVHVAPLEIVARSLGHSSLAKLVAVGAMTAMLGVILNLILGLSRVVLAMARRGDLPLGLAKVSTDRGSPDRATLVVGALIAGLVLIGNVRTTWSFSAFTVLIYYAITNLAAIRMTREERRYPVVVAWMGLASCLFLACWVDRPVWMAGLGLLGAGLLWQWVAKLIRRHGNGRGVANK